MQVSGGPGAIIAGRYIYFGCRGTDTSMRGSWVLLGTSYISFWLVNYGYRDVHLDEFPYCNRCAAKFNGALLRLNCLDTTPYLLTSPTPQAQATGILFFIVYYF